MPLLVVSLALTLAARSSSMNMAAKFAASRSP